MASELRQTGISVVGDAPWGTHFCHFYETKQDLLDTLVPYFKAGLERKEFCLWVISDSDLITLEEAKRALAQAVSDLDRHLSDGNIEILNGHEWYFEKNVLNLERVKKAWDAKLKRALAQGYDGLRVSGDTFWLAEKDWKDFCAYEKQVNDWVTDQPMTVLCTYPLAKSGASEVLDVAKTHHFAIARRQGEWEIIESPELIQAKAEIKKLNEDLEQRVIERTNELRAANEELRKEIGERKHAEEALGERLRFETLVTELSAAFANLSPNELDREIDKWLQTLVEFLGVDRASFFQFGEDWTTLYRSHSYTVPGIEPLPPPPIGMKEQFPWITDQLRQGVTVKWSRIPDDMPEEAEKEKEYAARLGVKSGLNIPVLMGGSVVCAIAFTSIATYRDWPDTMVARLRLVGEIFAAAVERKRAEALLHAKEQEFRAIVENAPDQIIRYDREFRRAYVNPAVARAYGLPREALIGKSIGSVIEDAGLDVKEDELTQLREQIANVFDSGKSYEYELNWPLPTGRKYFSVRLFPELDLNDSVVNVLGISRDITERRSAEEELKKEKEILEKIFDNIPVMIGFVGDDGRVKLVNPEWERTIGWTLKELQEQNVDIFAEAYPDVSYRQEVLDFVAAATGDWEDLKIRVRDGRVIDAACAVVHLSDGTRVAIAQDITDRKRAEERIRATSEQLRALSASVQSAKEEEGTRIAREIHDELGGALTSLRWDLESLDKVISESRVQSQFTALRGKIRAMLSLSETTISAVRRISSELRPSVLDDLGLAPAIEWQARQFQTRTGIICHCDCSAENIDLNQDQSTAIFRILQEALTNILRHAQATRVDIAIKEEAGEIVLTVSDNGRGITEDKKSSLQSLGLLGMRERAYLVGGEIDIMGVDAQGTVVTVRVPNAKR